MNDLDVALLYELIGAHNANTVRLANRVKALENRLDDVEQRLDQDALDDCCGGTQPKDQCCYYMPQDLPPVLDQGLTGHSVGFAGLPREPYPRPMIESCFNCHHSAMVHAGGTSGPCMFTGDCDCRAFVSNPAYDEPELCGDFSPVSGKACVEPKGHSGVHRGAIEYVSEPELCQCGHERVRHYLGEHGLADCFQCSCCNYVRKT